MSEMIERVAKAIDPLAWVIPEEDYPAERSRRGAKQFAAMSAARRAIEEMRDPSDDMARAGFLADAFRTPMARLEADFEPKAVWAAMIDEVLK